MGLRVHLHGHGHRRRAPPPRTRTRVTTRPPQSSSVVGASRIATSSIPKRRCCLICSRRSRGSRPASWRCGSSWRCFQPRSALSSQRRCGPRRSRDARRSYPSRPCSRTSSAGSGSAASRRTGRARSSAWSRLCSCLGVTSRDPLRLIVAGACAAIAIETRLMLAPVVLACLVTLMLRGARQSTLRLGVVVFCAF